MSQEDHFAVIGGTISGNRGAEAMVATTIGELSSRFPNARFTVLTYQPQADRRILNCERVSIADARPVSVVIQVLCASAIRLLGVLRIAVPESYIPAALRQVRQARAVLDVSGISFHDGRMSVVIYNFLSLLPAILLDIPVIRLSQAMGPFRQIANRLPARWITQRSLHTFARGSASAAYMTELGVDRAKWSVAPDTAFVFDDRYSLSEENPKRVAEVLHQLTKVKSSGTEVVAVFPSSLVMGKSEESGGDYLEVMLDVVRKLQQRDAHVILVPNATHEGSSEPRNNDIIAVRELVRLANMPGSQILSERLTAVDFDLNTKAIRAIIRNCSFIVTSRFHAMIAALSLSVPPFVIGWSHKYIEVLESFGLADLAIDHSNTDHMISALLAAFAERARTRATIEKLLPEVVAHARAQFDRAEGLVIGV